jgi:predicted permease
MLNETRYALRSLRRNPGFAVTAIVSIALAVGANSTLFSIANGLLFRPLPVPDAAELVTVRSLPPLASTLAVPGTSRSRMSYSDYRDFREKTQMFRVLIAYDEMMLALSGNDQAPAEFRLGYQVSSTFFGALEVKPVLGRGSQPEEEQAGSEPTVVLSHELWKNEFGGDPGVIGRRVVLNHLACRIVGVAPESFTGLDEFLRPDIFVPVSVGSRLYSDLEHERTDRALRTFMVKGRLKTATTVRMAAREAAAFAKSLERQYAGTNLGFGATVNTETEVRLISWPLLGGIVAALSTVAVVIVLLACANVANLMLSRGRTRAREIATRLAVGANRARLVRLLLLESFVIALASGAVALLAVQFTTGIFSTLELTSDAPIRPDFRFDGRMLWYTAVVSGACALLFGLLPALHSTRLDLVSVIKTGNLDPNRQRLAGTRALVVAQIAGAMILLVLAVQGRRTFNRLLVTSPGFRTDHRITMRFNPSALGYTPLQTQRFYDVLLTRVSQTAGVKSASLASGVPMTYDWESLRFFPETKRASPGKETADALAYIVAPGYFETMGVPMLAGRGFRPTDRADTPRVAVVNQAFADAFLGPSPIGKTLRLNAQGGLLVEVVGVTMTGKHVLLIEPPMQAIYLPLAQNPRSRMTLIAQTAGDPSTMAKPLETLVRAIDPAIPIFRVRTMQDLFERSSVNAIRTAGRIYDFSTALGVLLAVVGLYAVVSYQVAQRTREIGIRIALGAGRIQVGRLFLRQALLMSASGIGIGLGAGIFAEQTTQSILGASPPGPFLCGAVSIGLLITTITGALIPARNASVIDPQQALRAD